MKYIRKFALPACLILIMSSLIVLLAFYSGPPKVEAAWISAGTQAGEYYGTAIASGGDINNDGYADEVVGVPNYVNGDSIVGAVFVYYGSASGLSATPDLILEAEQTNSDFGVSVSSAGDVNHDSYDDVIVGASNYSSGSYTTEGKAYVYMGSAGGLASTPAWTMEPHVSNRMFGESVGSAGDVNGDSYDDVIVNEMSYTDYRWAAFVYLGSAGGLASTPVWTGVANYQYSKYGDGMISAGDVNHDGYGDVLLSDPYADYGGNNSGDVYLFLGTASGLSATPVWTGHAPETPGGFGNSIAVADLNHDGYMDLIIGDAGYSDGETHEGVVFIYYGSAGGFSNTPSVTLEENIANANFGLSVASVGDENKDGNNEIIVGSYNGDGSRHGMVYMYTSSEDGINPTPIWTATSDQANSWYGESVVGAGDINQDGFNDVLVGAPEYSISSGEGRVYMYSGPVETSETPTATPTTTPEPTGIACGHSGCMADDQCAGYTNNSDPYSYTCEEVIGNDPDQQFCEMICPSGQVLSGYCGCVDAPTATPTNTPTPTPTSCSTGNVNTDQVLLSAGTQYSCAVLSGGAVDCWGKNDSGQVGNGDESFDNVTTPDEAIGSGAKAVTTGAGYSCALMDDGTVKCWGRNDFGQLGTGNTGTNEYAPVDTVLSGITAISAGSGHTCALTTGGAVECWGKNNYGQVGNGDESGDNVLTPATVIASGAIAVGAGTGHTCALMNDSSVKCWGRNDFGQIGNNDDTFANVYAPVTTVVSGMRALSVGRSTNCALTFSGEVKCWGKNNYSQAGETNSVTAVMTPYTVITGGAEAVSAGTDHSCALMDSGVGKCWGRDSWGEVGTGDSQNIVATPYVFAASGVQAVSAGADHTCITTTDGGIKCWGKNTYGQVGNGVANGTAVVTPYASLADGVACYGETPTGTPTGTTTTTPTGTVSPTTTPEPSPSYSSSFNIPSSYVNIGEPNGMAMLPDGNIWYVDRLNWRLVLFNPNTNTIVRTVGRLGTAEGEFNEGIIDIAVDNDGFLYALHYGCQVYKLDANGGFLGLYNLHDTNPECHDTTTRGIHYDSVSGTLLVTDYDHGTVNKYSKDLVYQSGFGSNGSGDGEFNQPVGVTTDADGLIYVADRGNNRVQVFSATYAHLFNISGPWADIGGTTDFDWLSDVLILDNGTITVSNTNKNTIEQFAANGTHIRTWVNAYDTNSPSYMRSPEYLVKDAANNIYISDAWIKSVSKYSSTGTFISSLRNTQRTDGKFWFPTDLAYCPNDNLYVIDGSDAGNSRVQEFSNSGTWLATILGQGEGDLGENSQDISCDASGRLWVSSRYDVRIFAKSGSTWDLVNTIIGHFNGDQGWGGMGGIVISGDNVYIPNMQDSDIMKYTLNHSTGDYDYISSFGGGWSQADKNADPQVPPATGQLTYPYSVVMDSRGHFFVADWASLKEYDENGTFVKNLGVGYVDFQTARGVSIDPVNDHIYLTDDFGYGVDVYDNITGNKLYTLGNLAASYMGGGYWAGAGQMQFFRPNNSDINPVTHTLTIADTENSRLQSLASGYRIINLIPSADVVRNDNQGHNGVSIANLSWEPSAFSNAAAIPARLMFGDYVVADFTVDLATSDQNWGAVNVQTLPGNSKALVVNLNQTTAPGISPTHSLYVYRYSNQSGVGVCPDATTLADVSPTCSNEYDLHIGDPGLSEVTISGKNYWKIDGLTGTGAFSSLFETPYGLRDLMTREKVGTPSDHQINFSTTYDITHSDDTITISFGTDWDMSGLVLGDVSLVRDGTTLNLAATPATDTWGLSIADGVFTFTAPTDGTGGNITAGKPIQVVISNAHITNPDTVGSYPINIEILTEDGTGGHNLESGNIEVPIIDSDQVNVTGFINTFINFDIDTGTAADVDCSYNGCQLHLAQFLKH